MRDSLLRASPPYLLVTRPHPEGRSTCQRLRSMGYNVRWAPLLQCVHTGEKNILEQLRKVASLECIVVTSSRAISNLSANIISHIAHCTVVTVGKKTAKIAKKKGFHHVHFAGEHVAQLAVYIRFHLNRKTLIHFTRSYIAHEGAHDILVKHLPEYSITNILTYQMSPCPLRPLRTLLYQQRPFGILVFSQQISHTLASYFARDWRKESWENIYFFCLSERVSLPLRHGSSLKRIAFAKSPTIRALTTMIYKLFPPQR